MNQFFRLHAISLVALICCLAGCGPQAEDPTFEARVIDKSFSSSSSKSFSILVAQGQNVAILNATPNEYGKINKGDTVYLKQCGGSYYIVALKPEDQ